LMPDFDFDAFNHDESSEDYARESTAVEPTPVNGEQNETVQKEEPVTVAPPVVEVNNDPASAEEEVDKW